MRSLGLNSDIIGFQVADGRAVTNDKHTQLHDGSIVCSPSWSSLHDRVHSRGYLLTCACEEHLGQPWTGLTPRSKPTWFANGASRYETLWTMLPFLLVDIKLTVWLATLGNMEQSQGEGVRRHALG